MEKENVKQIPSQETIDAFNRLAGSIETDKTYEEIREERVKD